MTSPDVTPYVDLRLYDRTAPELVERARVDAAVRLPGFVWRTGSQEITLLEAMALQVVEAVFAINRLPSAVTEVLLRLLGVTFDPGAPPETTVTFTLVDDAGYTISAGTRVRLDVTDGQDFIVFTLTEPAVAAPTETTATAAAVGDRFTSIGNGVDDGTPVTILDVVTVATSAALGTPVTAGRDPESDQEWFSRAVQRLARLTDTLVVAAHFEAAALEDPAVYRVHAIDLYDGAGTPGEELGHIAVYVRGEDANLDAGAKTDLEASLEQRAHLGLEVHVLDPTITDVDVDVAVVRHPDAVAATVQAAVEDALAAYLSPATWDWSGTVYRNELISLVDQVPGVARVDDLTVPAADVVLAGAAALAQADEITVTVLDP